MNTSSKNQIKGAIIIALLVIIVLLVFSNSKQETQINIIAGEWNDGAFANSWSEISFVLPDGFQALTPDEMQAILGTGKEILTNSSYSNTYADMSEIKTYYDFVVYGDDLTTSAMLSYENLFFDNRQDLTPKAYYDMVKTQLADMDLQGTQFEFADSYSNTIIAEKEYLLLHAFVKGMFSQDYYACNYESALIVFTVTYTDESKASLDLFLSSIEKISSSAFGKQ